MLKPHFACLLLAASLGDSTLAQDCDPKNALEFDGNAFVTVPYSVSFPVEEFTLSAWARRETADTHAVIAFGENVTTDLFSWWFGFTGTSDLLLRLENASNDDRSYTGTAPFSLSDGTWHHIAATRDVAGTVHLYVDGMLVQSHANSVVPSGGVQDLTIGCLFGSSGGPMDPQPPTRLFEGEIDEVSMWETALSEPEIDALYQDRIADPTDARLKGYWKLDEGSGQVASDSSNAGNHGYLGEDPANVDPADPAWLISTAPMCCLDRGLCLNAEPNTIVAGDTFGTVTWSGLTGLPVLIVVVDVSGISTFLVIERDTFDAACEHHLTAVIPPGLPIVDVTFQSLGFGKSGKLEASNREVVEFR